MPPIGRQGYKVPLPSWHSLLVPVLETPGSYRDPTEKSDKEWKVCSLHQLGTCVLINSFQTLSMFEGLS